MRGDQLVKRPILQRDLQRAQLEAILTGGNTSRFHTLCTVRRNTVGQHSYGVALLCYLLTDGKPSVTLLMAALTHDIAEQWTGDIPAPAKRALGIREQMGQVEDEALEMVGLWLPTDQDDTATLKMADALDGMLLCVNERRLGNTQIETAYGNFQSYVKEQELEETAEQIYDMHPPNVEQSTMSEANDRQVGGQHYQSKYQHWDFVHNALNDRYLEGQITKYVARWRQKNGVQDIDKAIHYLIKLMERYAQGQVFPLNNAHASRRVEVGQEVNQFCAINSLSATERVIFEVLALWAATGSLAAVHGLLIKLREEAVNEERALEARKAGAAPSDKEVAIDGIIAAGEDPGHSYVNQD